MVNVSKLLINNDRTKGKDNMIKIIMVTFTISYLIFISNLKTTQYYPSTTHQINTEIIISN